MYKLPTKCSFAKRSCNPLSLLWTPMVSANSDRRISSMIVSRSSASNRMMWRIGPKISSSSSPRAPISQACGSTKYPLSAGSTEGLLATRVAEVSRRATYLSILAFATSSMTGPTSVARSCGSPTLSSCSAPARRPIILSATSVWINNTRSAEQRCPADLNADVMTSSMTCSGSAVESTIMQLIPPVSAMKGTMAPSRDAS